MFLNINMSEYCTSQKHVDFLRGSIHNKLIGEVAGIGDKASVILTEKGYKYGYNLLGIFLIHKKCPYKFDDWLQGEVPCMNPKHRSDCIQCFTEWCKNSL
jgi:hypothetical protein